MNATVKIEKDNGIDVMVIRIPMTKKQSASGKTTVVASTNGNHACGVEVDGKPVILGLNAYIK